MDDGRAEHDPRERLGQDPEVGQDAAGDSDARGGQGEAHERGRADALAEHQADGDAGGDRQDHRDERGEHGRPADGEQVVQAYLQADREEQDDDADLGQHEGRLAGDGQGEHAGAHDEAAQQLADHRRLTEPPGELLAGFGGHEQQEDGDHHVQRCR